MNGTSKATARTTGTPRGPLAARARAATFVVVALLGLGADPAPVRAGPTERLVGVVHEHLSAWRFQQAEALLTLLTAATPTHPEVRRARARLAYLRGEYGDAARLATGLPDVVGTTQVGALTRRIRAAEAETRGWIRRESRSGNFVFLHPPGPESILVPYAEEALEKARSVLAAELGLSPHGPVRVEFLPGPSALARLSPLTEDEVRRTGTIALCRDRKLMVVTPRALATGYAWLDTLGHEFVHYVLEATARDQVPLWLHEGLARYAQDRWRRPFPTALSPLQAHLLADALATGSLVPIARMMPSFAKLKDQREAALAYAQVTSMVLHLVSRHGREGLRALVGHLAAGRTTDEALRRVAGVDLAGLTARWKRELARARLARVPGYDYLGRSFSAPGGAAREPAAVPRGPVARYRRLGALLKARGRLQAARHAYARSFTASGESHGRVANSLGRLLLELKEPAEAARVAARALRFNEELAALHIVRARAAEATRRPAEAEAALFAANAVDPFDPEIHCRLARLLAARRAPEAAREQATCRRLKRD